MKGIIIYKGKYGATAQYVGWLSQAIKLPLLDADQATTDKIREYDTLVIGSSVYVGKLLLHDWFKQHIDILRYKKIFLFIVCGTSSSEKEKQAAIINSSIPKSLLKSMTVFFLPGRLIIDKLSFLDRLLIKAGAFMEKDPVKKQAMSKDFDGVKKECLDDLVKTINSSAIQINHSAVKRRTRLKSKVVLKKTVLL